jgi:hypothetical protein
MTTNVVFVGPHRQGKEGLSLFLPAIEWVQIIAWYKRKIAETFWLLTSFKSPQNYP